MGRKVKRELFLFSSIDYFSLKEHFEDMARKGWMLEKISFFTAKYRRIEPQELVFSVDVYPELKYFQGIDKKDIKSYINLCEEAGWKYVTSSNNLQIFYSEKEENLIPVQTDEEIKEKVVEKSIFMDLLSMVSSIFILSYSLRKLIPYNYKNLFTNMDLLYPIFIPLIIIGAIIYISGHLLWLIRAKRHVKENKPLPRTNYILAKIKGVMILGISVLVMIIFIVSIIMDSIIQSKPIFVFLAPVILMPIITYIYHKKIKPMNMGKFKKIAIVTVSVFAIYILTFIVAINLTVTDFDRDLGAGYFSYTLEDFHLGDIPHRKTFTNEGSILVPKKSVYLEYTRGWDSSIETVYVKSINKKIANYIFNEMIKEEKVKYHRKINSVKGEYQFFDEAYYINSPSQENKNNTVILLKDNEILLIYGSIDFSNKENVEIITKKLQAFTNNKESL